MMLHPYTAGNEMLSRNLCSLWFNDTFSKLKIGKNCQKQVRGRIIYLTGNAGVGQECDSALLQEVGLPFKVPL